MRISNPNEKGIQYPLKDLIKDIWNFAGTRRKYLVYGTILRALGDIAGLYPAYAIGVIVTGITKHTLSLHNLFIVIFFWGLAYVIRETFKFVSKKLIMTTAQAITYDMEKHMVQVLLSKDSAWHEKESSGAKIKRLERGSLSYKEILYLYVNEYIESIINFLSIPFILFNFDTTIALGMIFYLVMYFTISKYLLKNVIRTAYEVNVKEDELSGSVYEVVSNIRTVRVLHVGDAMNKKINIFTHNIFMALKKRIVAFQSRATIMSIFSNIFKIGIVSYIIYFIFIGKYEVGFIIIFVSYFDKLIENIREITDASQDVIVGRQAIFRMYDLIGKNIKKEKGFEDFPAKWDELTVKNLSFSYGGNEALRNISFSVKNGEKVGIVGLSGAGKSTLFKLLVRERTDYSGQIKIGDVNIGDIKTSDFYKNVSIVPQDTEVFNFSLKENITIAQPEKSDDKELIEKSLKISHVKEFLEKLSHGVDTLIGERGVKLSGGERQRLGIARAIFKEPSILLLDEATSHLDLESEEKIKDSLHTFFENVTAIVIAHRLTTIREMDKIIVIQDGGMIEEGSYDELMKKKGRFYELWQKQLF